MHRLVPIALLVAACESSLPGATVTDTSVTATAPFAATLVLPDDAGAGLEAAAADLMEVITTQGGCARLQGDGTPCDGALTLTVRRSADAPGAQSFRFAAEGSALVLDATGDAGAANGLYDLAERLGAVWIHPEEPLATVHDAERLPTPDGAWHTPRFALRGFHEHTQHPIPMSDYLLRPGSDDFRDRVSRYLRWMARNRQNILFFHALRTIDLATWAPYMKDITDEARGYGIVLGAVVGFADEQQHAFKLVQTASADPDADIRAGLDALLASGLGAVGFQIGTSEFTKPADADVLHWLEVATTHLQDQHPGVTPYAWIHITCSLESEDGGYFFHLPLQAPDALGAFVHTTMFYTLESPAPVYDCEDFSHQLEFIDAAEGERPLVFFPETAWWLGFDNNVPLVLPITGRSRQRDIDLLAGRDVMGHVTFTSGREWTYWQYDHYLTRATWSGESWEDYVDAIAPLYGPGETAARTLIRSVGRAQERLLYEDNPDLIFYLAGELPQDEAGAVAGILARRPKPAFKTIRDLDDAAFAEWKARDYDRLIAFGEELAPSVRLLETLEAGAPEGEQAQRLTLELVGAYRTLADRVAHAVALYGGVIAIRAGDRPGAEAKLAEARALSARVLARVAEVEGTYRDPLEILAQEKPDTLTAYPIGYLHETRTGYFWTRRDDQLQDLITATFEAPPQAWDQPPGAVFAVEADGLALTQPDDALVSSVITGFVPRLVLGVTAEGAGAHLAFAEDYDKNDLPDAGSLSAFTDADVADGRLAGTVERVPLVIHDAAGAVVGVVGIQGAAFDFAWDGAVLGDGTLEGGLETAPLVEAVLAIAGIDRAGIESLVKSVFKLPADEPLPEVVPVAFALSPEPLP